MAHAHCAFDEFSLRALDSGAVAACAGRRFNILDLEVRERISDRLGRVVVDGTVCIVKIARFKHELAALEREVRIYGVLKDREFAFAPRFIGYAYEEEESRVVGFLMEELHGQHPDIWDLAACEDAVWRLHGVGVVHGDLNRWNIIVLGGVARLINFGVARVVGEGGYKDAEAEAEDELGRLAERLLDVSGVGLR